MFVLPQRLRVKLREENVLLCLTFFCALWDKCMLSRITVRMTADQSDVRPQHIFFGQGTGPDVAPAPHSQLVRCSVVMYTMRWSCVNTFNNSGYCTLSQVGFIEFAVGPLYAALLKIFPRLRPCAVRPLVSWIRCG